MQSAELELSAVTTQKPSSLFKSLFVCTWSCHMWDLVPWRGMEPRPPQLGVQSLSHWTTRKSRETKFLMPCSFASPVPYLAQCSQHLYEVCIFSSPVFKGGHWDSEKRNHLPKNTQSSGVTELGLKLRLLSPRAWCSTTGVEWAGCDQTAWEWACFFFLAVLHSLRDFSSDQVLNPCPWQWE